MLFRKLWRTMRLYRAQFISMIVMIALGIGIFVGFNMEWYSIDRNVTSFFQDTGYADFRVLSEAGFSKEDAAKIGSLDGVDAVSRFLAVSADVKERSGDSLSLSVTENPEVSGFLLMEGAAYDRQSTDGIWLSDRYAEENKIHIGDTLTLVYRNLELRGIVRGLIKAGEYLVCVRDETQLMPDYSTFAFAYISPVMYENAVGTDYYPQIRVLSGMEKKAFTEAADNALRTTPLVLSKEETGSYSAAKGEVTEGKTMGTVLPVLFLLIAVLTMITTMHRLTAKEKTQIGTLKALGFKDRRILLHYTSYALMIGILGSAAGIALGYAVAFLIMNPDGAMGTYLDMPEWKLYLPWFCYLILAGILVLLTLIGFLSVRKMLHGTAADALRPYTPKRVKPLAIERTRWFHRLSFGVRWNLRDTARHKSRTAMSLLGTLGCMVILVCALGMRDTMNAFLALYYEDATHYASRIYLTEEATDAERAAVAECYAGDWSASVSVQLNEKAVSLDVFHVTRDKVRFPDRKDGFVQIGDDGAYICSRIAEEEGLSVGDTFTVSPYGSDRSYALRVAGILRSVSKNVVISPAYAAQLELPYTMDSVYTDTVKEEVAADPAIKNVQSRQMIMDSFGTFMEIMDLMIYLLVFGAMLLGLVVLYNRGVMSYTERYREMATLKVIGFRDRKIGKLLIGQNLWVSIVGIAVGLPLGVLALDYLLKMLASEYEMKLALGPATFLVSVLLTLGVSLAVSVLVARKNRSIDMVEALKGTE